MPNLMTLAKTYGLPGALAYFGVKAAGALPVKSAFLQGVAGVGGAIAGVALASKIK